MIKLQVITHSGVDDIVEVENYDPVEVVSKMNDNSVLGIVIGQNVYSRIDIKYIKPVVD